ncbi:MAG: transcriptional regulator, partial [Akkermansiaceae bacterium]|nr:transcriptional regulator [Akkermansiaceae bacterium]
MRISKKAEYAMRAVVAVARAPGGKLVPLAELATAEDIPPRFLEQIVL